MECSRPRSEPRTSPGPPRKSLVAATSGCHVALCLLTFIAAPTHAKPREPRLAPVEYRLTPEVVADTLRAAQIEVRFVAGDDTTTRVRLPSRSHPTSSTPRQGSRSPCAAYSSASRSGMTSASSRATTRAAIYAWHRAAPGRSRTTASQVASTPSCSRTCAIGTTPRTAPNTCIVTGFWSDRELQDLPYQRGVLLASLIDPRLRERSNGRIDMDDVFERMKQLAEATRPRGLLAGSAFVAAARELGVDPTPEIAANILNGAAFALPADGVP